MSPADGTETEAFFHFIAGLQNHMPAALAVIAPYVNSYRRYVKDHAAPINLAWARDNRTTGIRVPLEFKGDAYDEDGDIPRVLGQALDIFDEASEMHAVLGPDFARVYGIVKRAEYDEFLQVISPWEREHLLMNV